MDNMNCVTFCSKKREYRSLSNFWECEIVICENGVEYVYESGEHCFHGEKYRRIGMLCKDENRKKILLEYGKKFEKESVFKTCVEAKRGGGKKGLMLNKDEIDMWSSICIIVQNSICKYKYMNYEEVRNDLIKSGNMVLIHSAMRCSEEKIKSRIWEGKIVERDGVNIVLGGNKLGEIWMKIRNNM